MLASSLATDGFSATLSTLAMPAGRRRGGRGWRALVRTRRQAARWVGRSWEGRRRQRGGGSLEAGEMGGEVVVIPPFCARRRARGRHPGGQGAQRPEPSPLAGICGCRLFRARCSVRRTGDDEAGLVQRGPCAAQDRLLPEGHLRAHRGRLCRVAGDPWRQHRR
eukprot:1003781-Prymnesium_polylepis.1